MYPVNPVRSTAAILLAAGASLRMGTPKPLLFWKNEPLIRRLARTLRDGGVSRVIVVTTADAVGAQVAQLVADLPDVDTISNPTPERGMLSSIQVGLQEAEKTMPNLQAWLVCPVDLPLLESEHVAAVLSGWDGNAQAIVAPTAQGKRGHPTLFGSFWTEEIQAMDPEAVGLNAALAAHPECVREVPLPTDAIVRDADTPEEWQQLEQAGNEPMASHAS